MSIGEIPAVAVCVVQITLFDEAIESPQISKLIATFLFF